MLCNRIIIIQILFSCDHTMLVVWNSPWAFAAVVPHAALSCSRICAC